MLAQATPQNDAAEQPVDAEQWTRHAASVSPGVDAGEDVVSNCSETVSKKKRGRPPGRNPARTAFLAELSANHPHLSSERALLDADRCLSMVVLLIGRLAPDIEPWFRTAGGSGFKVRIVLALYRLFRNDVPGLVRVAREIAANDLTSAEAVAYCGRVLAWHRVTAARSSGRST